MNTAIYSILKLQRLSLFSIKHKVISIAIIFLLFLSPIFAENQVVKIGIFHASPLVIVNDYNNPDGFFIDLIKHIGKKSNWQIIYVFDTWNNLLSKLEKGEIDLLPALGYTLEREKVYDFTKTHAFIDTGVIYSKDNDTINNVFELDRQKIAAVQGSIFTDGFIKYIDEFKVKPEIIYVKDNIDVMKLISSGEVKAGVCIYSLGKELKKIYPITISAISFSPLALEFATPKNKNTDLLKTIEMQIKDMQSDSGSIYNISYKKWIIEDTKYEIPLWIWFLLSFIGCITAVLYHLNSILNRKVQVKTKYINEQLEKERVLTETLQISINQKETLLREVYHRTKNTMSVIQSLLSLQSSQFLNDKNVQKLVELTQNRIQAIALVHEMLYQSNNVSKINLKEYIPELCNLIITAHRIPEQKIITDINIEADYFLLDEAIPIGLILNELVTNSMKYAFPNNKNGIITILLKKNVDNNYIFIYHDDGVGFPDNFDFNNLLSLGMKLIFSIAEQQLGGKVHYFSEKGVQCEIELKADRYSSRI